MDLDIWIIRSEPPHLHLVPGVNKHPRYLDSAHSVIGSLHANHVKRVGGLVDKAGTYQVKGSDAAARAILAFALMRKGSSMVQFHSRPYILTVSLAC